jgi:hypothetical protein
MVVSYKYEQVRVKEFPYESVGSIQISFYVTTW